MKSTVSILLTIGLLALGIFFALRFVRTLRASEKKLEEAPPVELTADRTSHLEAMSARNTAERPTEDDMQRQRLGARGVPGQESPVGMTPQRAKKTPRHLEPGHTA